MISRRFLLKFLCLMPLAGCVTPNRLWEEQRRLDSSFADLPPLEYEKPKERAPLPARVEQPATISVNPIARSHWTDSPVLEWRVVEMGRVSRITVHHEGNPKPNNSNSWSDVVSDLRLIRKEHLKRMSAGDIGYHYIIDRAGRIWEGRPVKYQGAHSGGSANKGNIGVMLLGNFDIQQPTNQQLKSLEAFLKKLQQQYRLSSSAIFTHCELSVTRCPGTYLQNYMNALRRKL